MKKIILILAFLACSFTSFAQSMYSDAVECMNNGEYADAKIYWEALNDRNNTYGYKIVVCSVCIHLQSEAKKLIAAERFTKAIEKYQAILSKNPSDRNAREQIANCKRLRAEYLETNKILTYTNSEYGCTFKLPSYMKKSAGSNNEKTDFWSNDYNLHATITARVCGYSQTDNQILNNVINSYFGATVTYKRLKENCVVVSGYFADGLVFYDKSIIASRKTQYNGYEKILISAVVKSPRNDRRGGELAKYIYNDLVVHTTTVPSVKTNDTDYERWLRAIKINSKEGYDNYLKYAPYSSSHREEANGRKSLCEAREQYDKGMQSFSQSFAAIYFENAKKQFELGANYMTQSDKEMYLESYYKYCMSPNCSVNEIKQFINSYGWHPNIKVIRGCLVKALCAIGQYKSAKEYVQNNLNYPIWISEKTSLTQKQWLKYIKIQKKNKSSVQIVGEQLPANNSSVPIKGGADNPSASKQIMGKVLNAKGEAMAGTVIIVKGTATGTIADIEGNYRITAKLGDVLTFYFKRFKTQEITVGINSTINVTLSK